MSHRRTEEQSVVKRYTQPCIQTQPGTEFKVAEVPLFESAKGRWVRYEDFVKLEQALRNIRDFEPVVNGDYAVLEAIPAMRKIAISALTTQASDADVK